ncbi:MAG: hypothetical protein KJP10_04545 [Gammaproteobacteria bacterium]|nr:hypothetical protein [Gammaproteobacteria bacterium]
MQTVRQQPELTALARIAPALLIAVCLAVVVVFMLLAQYAHPSSDDFCMASGVNNHRLLPYLWQHYMEWSGRYSANALYAVYPLVFDLFEGYRFIPAFVIVALFAASACLLSTLFRTRLLSAPVLLASAVFVCVYLLGMLSPASGLYWMAGVCTYQTANVLFLVSLALMLRLARQQKHARPYAATLSILLLVVVIAVGANETSMLALTAITLLAAMLHLRSGWSVLWPWLLILAVALICFAIVYFSPGNEIRAADFPLRHGISRSIEGSLFVGLKVLWIWVSSPVLILASLLTPLALSRLVRSHGERLAGVSFKPTAVHIAILAICTLILPIVLQFPAWWSMGGWPPPRTVDTIYFLFLVSWFVTIGAVMFRFLPDSKDEPSAQSESWSAVSMLLLSVLFSIAVVENRVFENARADLFRHAPPYDEYLKSRYQQVARAKANGQHDLLVADYQREYPRTIYFNDIMHDGDHWRNACYADYFGLETIRIIN